MTSDIMTAAAGADGVVQGYPGPDPADSAARRRNRTALLLLDVERALTRLCGELAGLAADSEIFRGGLPGGPEPACGVVLTGELPESGADRRRFTASFIGRGDRDRLTAAVSRLAGELPLSHWTTVSGCGLSTPVVFTTLAPAGALQIEMVSDSGSLMAQAVLPLRLTVCTTAAAPCLA